MIKPIWALAGVALLGTAGIAGAVVAGSSGGEDEVVQQAKATTDAARPAPLLTPGPGVTLWRWMNVSLLIPDGSEVGASPTVVYFDVEGRQSRDGISVGKADPENPAIFSQVQIDAQNGKILSSKILDQDRAEMEAVLASIALSPFDPSAAPWPYNGEVPAGVKRESGFGMSFVRPSPATGIIIEYQIGAAAGGGDSTPAQCELGQQQSISVRNGRSSAHIWVDPVTNSLCKSDTLHPDDAGAFERFFLDVNTCDEETQCEPAG